jgi:hypothetical protein
VHRQALAGVPLPLDDRVEEFCRQQGYVMHVLGVRLSFQTDKIKRSRKIMHMLEWCRPPPPTISNAK